MQDTDLVTPLMLCLMSADPPVSVVRTLLQAKADVNKISRDGVLCLFFLSFARMLMCLVVSSFAGRSALHCAASSGHIECLRLVMSAKPRMLKSGGNITPLHYATGKKLSDEQTVRVLQELMKHPDALRCVNHPDLKGNYALDLASVTASRNQRDFSWRAKPT